MHFGPTVTVQDTRTQTVTTKQFASWEWSKAVAYAQKMEALIHCGKPGLRVTRSWPLKAEV